MATTMKVGDPTYYQGKKGRITNLPSLLGENGREQGVEMRYLLPADEAADRPKVSLVIDEITGKPTGEKLEEDWPSDHPRFAKTTCFGVDLRWDTGREAWIVAGHGLKKKGGYWPDASHPDNVLDEKEG